MRRTEVAAAVLGHSKRQNGNKWRESNQATITLQGDDAEGTWLGVADEEGGLHGSLYDGASRTKGDFTVEIVKVLLTTYLWGATLKSPSPGPSNFPVEVAQWP
jgi:hypothetical protein